MKRSDEKYCCKCGKELSKEEIECGKKKCENCIGKKAGKIKKIAKGTTAVLGSVLSIGLFIVGWKKK